MTNFIQLERVSRWFDSSAGRFNALKDITVSIGNGEFVGITGKSGSGKSTLLNMLTGIDHPSEGSVIIDNTEIQTLKESSLAAWRGNHIGIVFQFFQLVSTLTIRENILLAMEFVNVIPKKERERRADMLLEMVDISRHKDKFPASLSGGEQQRGAIARALANDPPIIVADEPTGNLDSKTAEAVFDSLSGLVRAGKTVLVVTHEKNTLAGFDRIITLCDGKIMND
jgi:putative ABC transport system ATP-binding protein